jgi:hypothetical protein
MKPLSAAKAAPTAASAAKFYKADHPRWIDYHIDFFGDGTPARLASIALCGEETLGLPA